MRYRRPRLGALARLVVAASLLIGVLFLAVFPTRAVLDQREAISQVDERIQVLREENERMRARIRGLSDPEAVERIAREQYNLARPGEEVFVIIPSEMEALRRSGVTDTVVSVIRDAWGFTQD